MKALRFWIRGSRFAAITWLVMMVCAATTIWADNAANKVGRWCIDFSWGYGGFKPADLNSITEYENSMQHFLNDTHLDYLQQNQTITSWSSTQVGSRPEIHGAEPLSVRLCYALSKHLELSAGVSYIKRNVSANVNYSYIRTVEYSFPGYSDRIQDTEAYAYAPFSLSMSAMATLAGVHWTSLVFKGWEVELFAAAGPLFGSCRYHSSWNYVWSEVEQFNGTTYDYGTVFSSHNAIDQKGNGIGITAEAGVRLNVNLTRRLGVFVDAGYALNRIDNISGAGSEIRGDYQNQWNGRWGIKNETVTTPWGTLSAKVPVSYWPAGQEWGKERNFMLNFSGFQGRIGLFFRF